MACTHCCWNSDVLPTLASLGSLFCTGWFVDFRTPLPASANHWASLPVCAPYFAWEKLASLLRLAPSLATQSIMGIVIMARAPAACVEEMNVSPRSPATLLASPMLSKYQSCPRLSAFNCQL